MKKFMIFLVLVSPFIFFVSCGSGDDETDNTDSGITGDSDSGEISNEDIPDTGTADADSGDTEAPDGNGDTAPDTDDTDTVPTDDEPEKNAEGCYIFAVDESTFGSVYRNTYYGDIKDNILGDKTERDVFGIDLFQTLDGTAVAGSYDLAEGSNKSYLDCTECVRVWQDHDNKNKVKIFFQESGTLVISEVDKNNQIKGTLSAKLIEVTVDPDTREATPVEGGECIAIENWSFDSDNCVPECDGKICGDDGCGGICKYGCGKDEYCNEEQTQCLPYNCKKISLDTFEIKSTDEGENYYEALAADNSAGSTDLKDILTLHFYDGEWNLVAPFEGVVDLGSEINSDYTTCTECILFYEDIDEEDDEYQTLYFQQSGELVFEEVKEGTFESKGHGSFRLIEVDEFDNFAPVQGGNCYEVSDFSWNTIQP